MEGDGGQNLWAWERMEKREEGAWLRCCPRCGEGKGRTWWCLTACGVQLCPRAAGSDQGWASAEGWGGDGCRSVKWRGRAAEEGEGPKRGQSPRRWWDFGRVEAVESKTAGKGGADSEVFPGEALRGRRRPRLVEQSFQKGKNNLRGCEAYIYIFFSFPEGAQVMRRRKAREKENVLGKSEEEEGAGAMLEAGSALQAAGWVAGGGGAAAGDAGRSSLEGAAWKEGQS